jgi:carbon-monoxide dehydrogenase large subunit
MPGMLYGRVLRSRLPHARILTVDTSRAEKLPGVVAVVTGKELPFLGGDSLYDQPFLAQDKVRFAGEPVAAVTAVDDATAEEAIGLIEVEYEPLPNVLDPIEAMKPESTLVHEHVEEYKKKSVVKPKAHTNICTYVEYGKGDVQKGFKESDFVFEDTFTTPMNHHCQIEPHGAIAVVDSVGKITVWTNNNSPYRIQTNLANALGIPTSRIRVIVPYIGGAFGGKGGLKVEPIAIALAMKVRGRPVKIIMSRPEVFTSSTVRHPSVITLKTGVKKDGTLLARYVRAIYDTGAYAERGPSVCVQGCRGGTGPYKIPHTKVEGYCVYTNNTLAGAFRGYGFPQTAWASEVQLDMIAEKLRIDPLELRMKNALEEGDELPISPDILPGGVGLKRCLIEAADAIRWKEAAGANRGKGIACFYKNTKTPSKSTARLRITHEGVVKLYVASTEQGQGVKTILAKIAAKELNIPIDRINVITSDTELAPEDESTGSSRTTFHMGNAIRNAALTLSKKLADMSKIEVSQDKIEVKQGELVVEGTGSYAILDLIKKLTRPGEDITVDGTYSPAIAGQLWEHHGIFWMYGAHAVEVEVDKETGLVTIIKAVAAHDVGKAIDRVCCEQQIEGGVVQGISTTLIEEVLMKDGTILNANFHDYKISTATDIPRAIEVKLIESPNPEGPYGAKGLGEGPIVPTAPAIAAAIYNAIGIRFKKFPITPEDIVLALKQR